MKQDISRTFVDLRLDLRHSVCNGLCRILRPDILHVTVVVVLLGVGLQRLALDGVHLESLEDQAMPAAQTGLHPFNERRENAFHVLCMCRKIPLEGCGRVGQGIAQRG